MARPRAKIDWKTLDAMLQFGPSLSLCCEQLGIGENTLLRALRRDHDMTFEEYKNKKMDVTRLKLQQKAIQMALQDKNTAMMIFCLKNLCKWSDNQDVNLSSEGVKLIIEKTSKPDE